jgi:hypothetical protein
MSIPSSCLYGCSYSHVLGCPGPTPPTADQVEALMFAYSDAVRAGEAQEAAWDAYIEIQETFDKRVGKTEL